MIIKNFDNIEDLEDYYFDDNHNLDIAYFRYKENIMDYITILETVCTNVDNLNIFYASFLDAEAKKYHYT